MASNKKDNFGNNLIDYLTDFENFKRKSELKKLKEDFEENERQRLKHQLKLRKKKKSSSYSKSKKKSGYSANSKNKHNSKNKLRKVGGLLLAASLAIGIPLKFELQDYYSKNELKAEYKFQTIKDESFFEGAFESLDNFADNVGEGITNIVKKFHSNNDEFIVNSSNNEYNVYINGKHYSGTGHIRVVDGKVISNDLDVPKETEKNTDIIVNSNNNKYDISINKNHFTGTGHFNIIKSRYISDFLYVPNETEKMKVLETNKYLHLIAENMSEDNNIAIMVNSSNDVYDAYFDGKFHVGTGRFSVVDGEVIFEGFDIPKRKKNKKVFKTNKYLYSKFISENGHIRDEYEYYFNMNGKKTINLHANVLDKDKNKILRFYTNRNINSLSEVQKDSIIFNGYKKSLSSGKLRKHAINYSSDMNSGSLLVLCLRRGYN